MGLRASVHFIWAEDGIQSDFGYCSDAMLWFPLWVISLGIDVNKKLWRWDYGREVIFLFLFCGFLIGRSVKNMNPSKSPFVEAIEDKVRKKDKVAHNIR